MLQLRLSMFPNGVTPITEVLDFAKQDGRVTYYRVQLPVFGHTEVNVARFRMITSHLSVHARFAAETRSALLIDDDVSPDTVFASLEWRRIRVQQDQQPPEWPGIRRGLSVKG